MKQLSNGKLGGGDGIVFSYRLQGKRANKAKKMLKE
jgi:hypothetical protein